MIKKYVILIIAILLLIPINTYAVSKKTIKSYTKTYMLKKYKWDNSQFKALNKIIIHESNWNYKSVNKYSGACGLFQAYPCNKMKKYGKDYKTNYKVQVKWGLNYIKKRYKTPKKAWNFWLSHHWY